MLHNGILVVGSKGVVAGDANNGGGVGEVVPGGEEEEEEDRNDLLLRSHHNQQAASTMFQISSNHSHMQSPVSVVEPEV